MVLILADAAAPIRVIRAAEIAVRLRRVVPTGRRTILALAALYGVQRCGEVAPAVQAGARNGRAGWWYNAHVNPSCGLAVPGVLQAPPGLRIHVLIIPHAPRLYGFLLP